MMDEFVYVVLLSIVALFVLFRTQTKLDDEGIRTLYRQTARYAVASTQDDSPVIRTLHANYAMGYLMALKDLVTSADFQRATGKNLVDFERKIAQVQDASTIGLVSARPDLIPAEDPELLKAMYLL
jgi:hypothetical protein